MSKKSSDVELTEDDKSKLAKQLHAFRHGNRTTRQHIVRDLAKAIHPDNTHPLLVTKYRKVSVCKNHSAIETNLTDRPTTRPSRTGFLTVVENQTTSHCFEVEDILAEKYSIKIMAKILQRLRTRLSRS